MNGLLLVLFGGLAVAVIFAYLGGRQAGLGRGEQDRGDLAEENGALRKYVGGLEERVGAQHHRIVAMTAWETVPWPDGRTSPVPVRPEAQPVPALLAAPTARIPGPRREKRTSTAAFFDLPAPEHPAAGPVLSAGQWIAGFRRVVEGAGNTTDLAEPADPDTDPAWTWKEWPEIEDQIWSFKTWLATL